MKDLLVESTTMTPAQRMLKALLIGQFAKMKRGQLQLIDETGAVHTFGAENSSASLAQVIVKSANFYTRCVLSGAIGFSESFMDGEWTSPDLVPVIEWFILNAQESTVLEESKFKSKLINPLLSLNRFRHKLRDNTVAMSKKNIEEHYDLGNEFFKLFLDETMTYSSAIFLNRQDSLADAQRRKVERLCEKLQLSRHDNVLEIGCGWGYFATYAAKTYGCKITCLTLSEEQNVYVKQLIREQTLEHLVSVRICDFRHVQGKFSKIVSVEMVEALGDSKIDIFFKCCDRLLADDGLLAIQMITTPHCRYEVLKNGVDFIQKHIFPGSQLLSIERVSEALNRYSTLHLLDLYDFAESYAMTLRAWHVNFVDNLQSVRHQGFSEKFIRKWIYYFSYCQAAFATRQISVVQAVYTRPNNPHLARKMSE